MKDSDERRIVRFEDLNLLGKAVFLTGAALRTTATLLDQAVDRAADLYLEAEEAFKRELDDSIEEATIIDEQPRQRS